MNDTTNQENCNNCKYYVYRIFDNQCVRFPNYVVRTPNEWCGEYKKAAWRNGKST